MHPTPLRHKRPGSTFILLYPSNRYIPFPQMYDDHPALSDSPTGRPLLSCRPYSHPYRRSVAAVETLCDYTDTLREDMAEILSWMDEMHRLDAGENWRLACKYHFCLLLLFRNSWYGCAALLPSC